METTISKINFTEEFSSHACVPKDILDKVTTEYQETADNANKAFF